MNTMSNSPSTSTKVNKASRTVPVLNSAKLLIDSNGYLRSKSYRFAVELENTLHTIIKAESCGFIQFGSFTIKAKYNKTSIKNVQSCEALFTSDPIKCLYTCDQILNEKQNELKLSEMESRRLKLSNDDWVTVGFIDSPGILWDRTVVSDAQKNAQSIILYSNTSRTGDLMHMTVGVPKICQETIVNISKLICNSSNLPMDCSLMISQFLGIVYWQKNLTNVKTSNCHKFIAHSKSTKNENKKENKVNFVKNIANIKNLAINNGRSIFAAVDKKNKSIDDIQRMSLMHNRLPSWNPYINAYTLEFGGRALMPSVHNFQLVDEALDVILQLGKVKNNEFNVDFAFPLSPFQAFSICLSVIDRTFVWD